MARKAFVVATHRGTILSVTHYEKGGTHVTVQYGDEKRDDAYGRGGLPTKFDGFVDARPGDTFYAQLKIEPASTGATRKPAKVRRTRRATRRKGVKK